MYVPFLTPFPGRLDLLPDLRYPQYPPQDSGPGNIDYQQFGTLYQLFPIESVETLSIWDSRQVLNRGERHQISENGS